MEQCIYNIGSLRYFLTTAFGKNRQIVRETIEWKDVKGETKTDSQTCDYIMTLGKKALIITKANPDNSVVRKPFVVKPWKRVGKMANGNQKVTSYIDIDGHIWNHLKDAEGEMISYYNGVDHQEEEPSQFEKGITKFFHFEVHPAYT